MAGNEAAQARTNRRIAWVSLLLFVPCFFGAFLVGEGLISLLGYEVGDSVRPPIWAAMVATVPALVVFALPLWPTWVFGRRAGDRKAMIPFWIEAVLVTVFVVLNTVPLGQ
ncbi:hypothetical protein [Propionicimonas sp.]|uniref:hypothetical protein n=1 Tax=Propionicimonas sp. TaxID=1955623 RepID=UPI001791A299|nr:hypothetical protein [Propionicimonas sp.]MBU3976369.1 hypothetical protein [Actinomycetota bacterium]MBA3022038.1 hypothetical protein [Propionicimonas sp.]MBU3987526.1 hypothetical protein [Actinomycetota bacterium]MBU4006529.1 hypothetical protein [Actinomycetota bacterium]MBU4065134.1 hypothetical protein [Actinomycetota bacterium]